MKHLSSCVFIFVLLLMSLAGCTNDDDICYVTHCKFMYDKGVSYEYCVQEYICYDDDISRSYR